MGCTCTKAAGGLEGSGAKKWLKLENVAASVQTFPRKDGHDGITVVTAGMDKQRLVTTLEQSFHNRGLGIESGDWCVKGCLFHGTFDLYPLGSSPPNSFQEGEVVSIQTDFCDDNDKFVSKHHHGALARLLHVDVRHTMGEELHVVLISMLNQVDGRYAPGKIVRGTLSRRKDASPLKKYKDATDPDADRDAFWVWVDVQNPRALLDGAFGSAKALKDRLHVERRALEEEDDQKTIATMLSEPIPGQETSDRLLNALRLADHRALQKTLLELPTALLEIVQKTPYKLQPSSWGYQREGFHKYMGSGIILQERTGSEGQAPVLQFTTLFVSDKSCAKGSWKPAALRGERQYALFTNSIDVNQQRFTIENVFLNGIVPERQNIGAIASAEQLFAPVWENGAAGLGEILPVHKIQEVKLKDVVNWNTYAVVSFALSQRGIRADEFGEHFQASINEELRVAGLTRDDCKTWPLRDIVLRTQLGKFVSRILNQWHEKTAIRLQCTSAEVSFSNIRDSFDYIAGEARALMAVIIQVEVVYTELLARQISPEQAEALQLRGKASPGEEALVRWMAAISASTVAIDHGFRFGDASGDENMPIPAMRVLSRALRELQGERARSCEAVASDSNLDESYEVIVDTMNKQRHVVDGVFVESLELNDASIMREVLSSLILLRSAVDSHLGNKQSLSWEERYKTICADPRSYNSLIGTLIEWLSSACKRSQMIDEPSAETIRLFCYFSEQLGRERAFVLARGDASTSNADEDGMRKLALMSATRTLIGDLLQINSTAFRNFETRCLYGDIQDGTDWWQTISPCIDACHDLVRKLLDQVDDDTVSA